jgi:hypothetical protein
MSVAFFIQQPVDFTKASCAEWQLKVTNAFCLPTKERRGTIEEERKEGEGRYRRKERRRGKIEEERKEGGERYRRKEKKEGKDRGGT